MYYLLFFFTFATSNAKNYRLATSIFRHGLHELAGILLKKQMLI